MARGIEPKNCRGKHCARDPSTANGVSAPIISSMPPIDWINLVANRPPDRNPELGGEFCRVHQFTATMLHKSNPNKLARSDSADGTRAFEISGNINCCNLTYSIAPLLLATCRSPPEACSQSSIPCVSWT